MTESEFQRRVIDYARLRGWRVHHGRTVNVAGRGHMTPLQGDRGFPDLALARRGVVLLAELKQDGRYPDPRQRAWGEAIGASWRIWKPRDWDAIMEELR